MQFAHVDPLRAGLSQPSQQPRQEGNQSRRAQRDKQIANPRPAAGRDYCFTASNEMLFTPNFLLAPRALSEMNW